MLPSAHCSSGVILFFLMSSAGIFPQNFAYLAIMITSSVLVDFDYLIPGMHMHRDLPTHTLVFWSGILAPLIIFVPNLWILVLPIMFHLFLDLFDWGIMVFYPFSRKKYGPKILEPRLKAIRGPVRGRRTYLKIYLANPVMDALETAFVVVSILLLIGWLTWF